MFEPNKRMTCQTDGCNLTAYPSTRDMHFGQLYPSYECRDGHTSEVPMNAE